MMVESFMVYKCPRCNAIVNKEEKLHTCECGFFGLDVNLVKQDTGLPFLLDDCKVTEIGYVDTINLSLKRLLNEANKGDVFTVRIINETKVRRDNGMYREDIHDVLSKRSKRYIKSLSETEELDMYEENGDAKYEAMQDEVEYRKELIDEYDKLGDDYFDDIQERDDDDIGPDGEIYGHR